MLVDVLSRGRDLWAFTDPRQHFWREREAPAQMFEGAARLALLGQHRNPAAIEVFAAQYAADGDTAALAVAEPSAPAGSVRVVVVKPERLLEAVAGEVAEWRRADVQPGDIAIVTVAGQTKSEIVGRPDLLGEPLVAAESADADHKVVADTFLRFKGFERPYVVVTELGGEEERREYDTRMYIALTRATAGVVVVCTEEERAHDARLAR